MRLNKNMIATEGTYYCCLCKRSSEKEAPVPEMLNLLISRVVDLHLVVNHLPPRRMDGEIPSTHSTWT